MNVYSAVVRWSVLYMLCPLGMSTLLAVFLGFPGGSDGKESTCQCGRPDSIPGLGRSLVEGVATHSSVLAWKTPRTEKPGRLGHNWSDLLIGSIRSVQFSRSVVSDSSWPHGPQNARTPCPSPTPGVYSNSSPLSRWCHSTISSSVVPFSSCLQSIQASGSFQMGQIVASGGQSIGVSASTSVLPMNTQNWSPLGWTGWSSLQSKGLSRVFYNTTVQKHQFFQCSAFFIIQLSHPYMTTRKPIALPRQTFVGKVMSLLFNMLSRLVINFLPRSKRLLISWLQSPSAGILEPPK